MRGRASVQGKAQLPGKETLLSVVANSPMSNTVRHCFVLLVFAGGMMALLLSAGCGTLTNGRSWGQDAVFPGDLKNISRAAHDAFFDLQTLIPAAGALIFAIDDFDDRVSDWASDHNPIFGSDENAQDASDVLRNVLLAEFFVTALATPSGDDPKKWAYAKSKGLASVRMKATTIVFLQGIPRPLFPLRRWRIEILTQSVCQKNSNARSKSATLSWRPAWPGRE
jgi:hypothetical protein